jgi:hypothetical protein
MNLRNIMFAWMTLQQCQRNGVCTVWHWQWFYETAASTSTSTPKKRSIYVTRQNIIPNIDMCHLQGQNSHHWSIPEYKPTQNTVINTVIHQEVYQRVLHTGQSLLNEFSVICYMKLFNPVTKYYCSTCKIC